MDAQRVDDELSLVGSINFDVLSLDELEEDALVAQDRAFNEEMSKSFEAACARSEQVH